MRRFEGQAAPGAFLGRARLRVFLKWARLRAFLKWARLRATEASTWAGLAMIAVVLGSDPMQAHGVAQAISLIIGGGLVATGPLPEASR